MSVHINDLFEFGIFNLKETQPKAFDLAADMIFDQVKSAICFDMGDMYCLSEISIIPELVVLPYDTCWMEGHLVAKGMQFQIAHICTQIGGGIRAHSMLRDSVTKKWVYWFSWDLDEQGGLKIENAHESDKAWFYSQDVVLASVSALEQFLSVLNCTNVKRVCNEPPPKLQKARAKRGKKPLFSYWTLDIDLPRPRGNGDWLGGTHASPRIHTRRRHQREYAPGKWCWVRPHVVGNKAAGMVHKDYAAHYQ